MARYEKVRVNGTVRDVAVLIAIGVTDVGKREVIGVSVKAGEHEVHWRQFLQSLLSRGLCGVELIISDAHTGLCAARRAVFGGVRWQRCQAHLQRNAQAYVPSLSMKTTVAQQIREIFNAASRDEADQRLKKLVENYRKTAEKLADWLEENIPDGLTCFDFPSSHRRLIGTTNGLERLNREIARRTRVVGIFANEASCLRLVTAIVIEISDDWLAGRAYVNFQHQ